MQHADDFLLGLYREAREQPPEAFHELLLDRVQQRFGFSSAFWCEAHVANAVTLVPTGLRIRNIDPAFLVEWTELHPQDPAVPAALSNPGQAFRVHVPSFYAQVPDLAESLRNHGIQAMTVLLVPGAWTRAVQAIALYQSRAEDMCTDADKRWLEWAMPHLGEALRVNAAIHAPAANGPGVHGSGVAVVEAATGRLLRADPAFLALLAREWSGFDGRDLPPRFARAWQRSPRFAHLGRQVRIEGRCSGPLVYLMAWPAATESLTPRQLEVASLYAEGLSSKQIAQRCNLAPATVRTHLAAVYEILGVHGKIEMAHQLQRVLEIGGARRRLPLAGRATGPAPGG